MIPTNRVSVIGSCISDCNRQRAFDVLCDCLQSGQGGYTCFTSVHTAVVGRRDVTFRAITNGSLLTFADGTPIYWLARLKGAQSIAHLPGPDFMLEILERFPDQGHFFYGSTPEVLSQMQARLRQRMPHLRISGMLSPPFRAITSEELQAHYSMIRESEARFVWVGLGAPKQERWMSESWRELKPAVLLGVGAAFDFCAGALRRAPPQMRAVGLEWLYRLGQEPKRLWKRYLVNNSLFIGYALPDILSRRQETTRN